MAVILEIAGQRYVAENAAEESTLEEILFAIEKQTASTDKQTSAITKNQKQQTVNTQQSNQALGNFNQAARRTENTLEDLERSADKAGGSLIDTANSVASGFTGAIRSITSGLESGEISTKALVSDIADAASKGLSGLSTAIGGGIGTLLGGPAGAAIGSKVGSAFGDVVGGSLVTFAGVVGTVIGYMEGLQNTINTLANDGVIFGDGISKSTEDVLASGMTLNQFSKLVQESSDSLRVLGGSASQGAQRFLKLYKNLEQSRNQFTNLGFAFEDLPGLMADYTASIERFGQTTDKMSDKQLAQNTLEYAKNLRALADITGDDLKTAREKKKAVMEEAQLQNVMIQLSKSGVKDAADRVNNTIRMMEMAGISTEGAIEMINRGVVTGKDAYVASQAGINEALLTLREQLYSAGANVDLETFNEGLVQTLKDNAPTIRKSIENSLAPIAAIGGDKVADITSKIGITYNNLKGIETLDVQKIYENIKAATESTDPTNKGLAQLADAQQQMKESLVKMANTLTANTAEYITPAIKHLANAMELGAKEMTEFMKDPSGYTKNKVVGEETAAEKEAGILPKIGAAAADLPVTVIAGLTDQLAKLFGYDLGLKTITPFYDHFIRMSDEDRKRANDELEKSFDELSKSNQSAFGALMDKLFGQETPSINVPQIDDNQSSVNASPMAYGDIVKPTPGGKIVRIAEAGEAEAILPTERTQSGQLGVKVTGELIDSSYLMKTLVDTNKGGNNLLATLVSKIDGLNANFEKLVSEQRQANRLAV